ncbi:MAG TPA: hypothetical protein GX517_00410 [Alicyclobacillus sp.]|nr:hypothetical protein [Alicyclobacillus sp.]
MKIGKEEGRNKGREEGDRAARREVVRALLEEGDELKKVVEVTKLPKEDVEAIQKELGGDR